MLYKSKYIKYKTKYLNLKYQQGGIFNLDEQNYQNISPTILRSKKYKNHNPKYIAGPISLTIINNVKFNKKIYMFGDVHKYTSSFDCGPNDDTETIYLPEYLNNFFSTLTNKYVDLFIELPYQAEKTKPIPEMEPGILNTIRHIVDPIF